MKTLVLFTASLSPIAMAHGGHHSGSLMATLGHLFSQPDHLILADSA